MAFKNFSVNLQAKNGKHNLPKMTMNKGACNRYVTIFPFPQKFCTQKAPQLVIQVT